MDNHLIPLTDLMVVPELAWIATWLTSIFWLILSDCPHSEIFVFEYFIYFSLQNNFIALFRYTYCNYIHHLIWNDLNILQQEIMY